MSFLKKTTWKIGEEGASDVIDRNIRAMQVLTDEIETCCANELCRWPLPDDREANYGAPGFGQICAVCHAVYTSLSNMNPHLGKRPTWFKDAHEAWKKEIEEFKQRRKRMGD